MYGITILGPTFLATKNQANTEALPPSSNRKLWRSPGIDVSDMEVIVLYRGMGHPCLNREICNNANMLHGTGIFTVPTLIPYIYIKYQVNISVPWGIWDGYINHYGLHEFIPYHIEINISLDPSTNGEW